MAQHINMMFENKFRELVVEPGEVGFKKIRIAKILEYLHAGNDVIHCVDHHMFTTLSNFPATKMPISTMKYPCLSA